MKNFLSFLSKKNEPASSVPSASPVVQPVAQVAPAPVAAALVKREAPGSAGEIKLYNVPDKQAVMIMAIVAESIGLPLNQLRFRSIRLIEDSSK